MISEYEYFRNGTFIQNHDCSNKSKQEAMSSVSDWTVQRGVSFHSIVSLFNNKTLFIEPSK